jgi:hypothetical protein
MKWERHWMKHAELIASMSPCPRGNHVKHLAHYVEVIHAQGLINVLCQVHQPRLGAIMLRSMP